jgi:hypothetical protein
MSAIDHSRPEDAAQRNGKLPRRFRRRRPHLGLAGADEPERVDIPFLDCGPEIVMALGSGASAFQDVVLAFFFGRQDDAGENTLDCSDEDRIVLRENFNVLLRNFETEHGRISRSYFARHCLAAAVLTCGDEIEVVLARDIPSSDLVQVIRRAQALGYQAWHRLELYDRSLCQRMIFSVILEVLRRLDQSHEAGNKNASLSNAELAHLRRNLDEAEDFMLRCATRRAQTEYLRGMLNRGSVLLVLLLAAAVATVVMNESFNDVLGQTVLVAIAGAVGATVSVMWRMTSGTFSINLPTLDYGSARSQLRLMGAVRPAIGSIFALAVFVFAMSPILPLDSGSKGDTFFVVALGFLAGFSERFAQDMFVRSGQGLAGPGGDSPSSGLSAGLAPPPGGRPPASAAVS